MDLELAKGADDAADDGGFSWDLLLEDNDSETTESIYV
jgi:hypothetical protein